MTPAMGKATARKREIIIFALLVMPSERFFWKQLMEFPQILHCCGRLPGSAYHQVKRDYHTGTSITSGRA
jgi:hypothetical protein